MKARSDYQAVVAKAEKAVEGVKDPELKRVAFQRVLDDMLGGQDRKPSGKQIAPTQRAAATRRDEKNRVKRGPQGYVEELVADGFFKKPKTIGEVKTELENRGHHIPTTSLSGPLQVLCQRKTLRRQRAVGGKKTQAFAYTEW